jgi:hypothetical protein
MYEKPNELLQKARARAGFKSAAEAARANKWKEAGYRHHENGTRPITLPAAKRYEKAFGVKAADLLSIKTAKPNFLNVLEEEDGIVAAMGLWRNTDMDDKTAKGKQRSGGRSGNMRRRVLVNDESVNRSISAGEWALYEDFDTSTDPLPDNRLVYIERRQGNLAERSIRRVDVRGSGTVDLVSHSTVPKYLEKLSYPSKKQGETIEILGIVVGKQVEFDH